MTTDSLHDYSESLASAVEAAATWIVTVSARRRFAATGISWGDGLIVTADHVVEDEDNITVTPADGERASADLVGRDPGSDIAVLRIAIAVPAAQVAPEDSVRVGQLVLAVGRPGTQTEASLGAVSALGGLAGLALAPASRAPSGLTRPSSPASPAGRSSTLEAASWA